MSEQEESLASLLGGSSAFHEPVKAAEVQPQVEQPKQEPAPEQKAQARDEGGKFAKVEEPQEQPKVATPETPQAPPLAATLDERRRRQDAERERDQLRLQLQKLQEPAKPPPSVFEDEDGAISQRVDSRLVPMQRAFLDQSVTLAKLLHKEDWNEAEDAFIEAVNADPELAQRFREAPNPGEFAYQAGIHHREMAKYGGSIVAMREAIRGESAKQLSDANARVTALEKEIADLKASKEEAASVPKSLNGKASGVVSAETPSDDEPLTSITRFGKG